MRPNTLGSLRWIAAACLLSGCYRPWMYPQQQGYYGSPMYNQSYGGYQGIQTLTPGPYYAPNGTLQGSSVPNGLQPTPDENSSGNGSGGSNGGGEAPVYNPGAETPSRPVPTYDGDQPGAGLEEPNSDAPVQENNSGNGFPGAMAEPIPSAEWGSGQSIEQTGLESKALETVGNREPAAEEDVPTAPADDDEAPPLLAP